jgi:hypothetical protein
VIQESHKNTTTHAVISGANPLVPLLYLQPFYSERGRQSPGGVHSEAAAAHPAADHVRGHPHRRPRVVDRGQHGQILGEWRYS